MRAASIFVLSLWSSSQLGCRSGDSTSGDSTSSDSTSSDSTSSDSTSAGVCEVVGCVEQVGSCHTSSGPCDTPPCTSVDANCEAPLLCGTPTIYVLDYLSSESSDSGDPNPPDFIDDIEAARCFMAALRDRLPGRLDLIWGDPQGQGTDGSTGWHAEIYSRGDGTVSVQATSWTFDAAGLAYEFYATNDVQLESIEYFTACANEPSEDGLIACFWAADAPILQLPWLTETCSPFGGC